MKKTKKNRGLIEDLDPAHEFAFAMNFAYVTLENEPNKEDQIIILDFILDAIREDLKTSCLTSIFYNRENFEGIHSRPFPDNYYDESGNLLTIPCGDKETKEVDLSKECVLVFPWHRGRLRSQIKNIYRNKFIYQDNNHFSYYYPYLKICYVWNGYHSISAGIVHKKGYIKAKEKDITPLFRHIYTDGLYWYNSHTKEKLFDLFDFRVGLIYEISKIKYKLENY